MVNFAAVIACQDEFEIERHENHLNKYGKVYWGSKFYAKSDNFDYPFNAYLYVNEIGVCYRFIIESIESKNKKTFPEFPQFICEYYPEINQRKPDHKTWWLVKDIKKIELLNLKNMKKHNGEYLNDNYPPRSYARIFDNRNANIID